MSDDKGAQELIGGLLFLADALERQDPEAFSFHGMTRVAAREIAELRSLRPAPDLCPGCNERPIEQPTTGRPRKLCTACSPPRRKLGEKSKVAS